MSEEPQDRREYRQPFRRVLGRGAGTRAPGGPRGGGRFHNRERYQQHRRQLPIEELIGILIRSHGLTDAARQQCIFIYWREMVGERLADKALPELINDGILRASAKTSTWVHEMQFYKAQMIEQINAWAETHRQWLGPPPLVTDIRFALRSQQRQPIADFDHISRLRLRHLRRLRPKDLEAPPPPSEADRAAILAETTAVEDDELRSTIEQVRILWNR